MINYDEEHKKQYEILKADLMKNLDTNKDKVPEFSLFVNWALGALATSFAAIKVLQEENNMLKLPSNKSESFIN